MPVSEIVFESISQVKLTYKNRHASQDKIEKNRVFLFLYWLLLMLLIFSV